jgi:AraC-like DNA-binding protein
MKAYPQTGAPAVAPGGAIIVTAVGAVPDVLRDLGVDPAAALGAAGIDAGQLGEPTTTIPYAAMGRLLTRCVALTRCPHFGLLVGAREGASSLGVVGFLALHSPDVGTGLRNLVAHMHHYQRGAVPTLSSDGATARFGYVIYQRNVESIDQIYDGAMALCTNILRALCGPAWKPSEIALAKPAPRDLAPYRKFFQAPLRFDAEETCIAFASHWLEEAVPDADPMLYRVLRRQVDQLEAQHGTGLAATLRGIVRTLLVSGTCSADAAAAMLGVHRRTLHRHLKAEHVTFDALVEAVRAELARELLADPRTPLSQVAATLGYADASAFSRAFRRWFATTPARWRSENAAGVTRTALAAPPAIARQASQPPAPRGRRTS